MNEETISPLDRSDYSKSDFSLHFCGSIHPSSALSGLQHPKHRSPCPSCSIPIFVDFLSISPSLQPVFAPPPSPPLLHPLLSLLPRSFFSLPTSLHLHSNVPASQLIGSFHPPHHSLVPLLSPAFPLAPQDMRHSHSLDFPRFFPCFQSLSNFLHDSFPANEKQQ